MSEILKMKLLSRRSLKLEREVRLKTQKVEENLSDRRELEIPLNKLKRGKKAVE